MMIMINLYQDGNFYDDLPHTRIFMMTYLSQNQNFYDDLPISGRECRVSDTNLKLSLLMYISYFVLFARSES